MIDIIIIISGNSSFSQKKKKSQKLTEIWMCVHEHSQKALIRHIDETKQQYVHSCISLLDIECHKDIAESST